MTTILLARRWLCGAVMGLTTCAASPGFASQSAIAANDAVVLSPPTSPDNVLITPDKPVTASGKPTVVSDAMTKPVPSPDNAGETSSAKAANPTSATPARESLGLGLPVSASPKVSVATGGEPKNWWSAFDPRKNEITRVLGALAVVIGLVLLGKSFLRRAGGAMPGQERPSGVMEILARYPVARGQQMILMKIARRIVVLHQAGHAMTTVSEITDPDEVAGLLSRMEAGSNQRGAAKFRQTLNDFHAEHESESAFSRPRGLPRGDTQVIDLTRSQGKGIGRILGKRATR